MSKKTEQIERVRSLLEEFGELSPHERREIEACLEALASAIWLRFGKKGKPRDFSASIDVLPFGKKAKELIKELHAEIQSAIEGADYDDDDEQATELLSDLIADLYFTFDEALKKLESK